MSGWILLMVGCGVLALSAVADVIVNDKYDTIVEEYNDLPARFGPPFDIDGLLAYAVMASNMFGCEPLQGPPGDADDPLTAFVVLIARNNCSFFEKVQNAEKAGFNAAIVYNLDSDDLIEMSGDKGSHEDVNIPSMFIGHSSAEDIEKHYLYDQNKSFVLVLNRNLPFNINTHLLWPFVIIVVITFVTMIVVTIVKCIRHRNRVQRDRLPRRDLRRLTIIRHDPQTGRYDTCSICLDDFVEGELLRVLPCQHVYHKGCVDPWLTKGKRNCPLCKRKIRVRRARRRSDTESSTSSNDSITAPLVHQPRGETTRTSTVSNIRNVIRHLLSSADSVVNEQVNPIVASSVSAVVDMSPEGSVTTTPPPAIFQTPAPQAVTGGAATTEPGPSSSLDVLITTPISSPLRNAAQAQQTRPRSQSTEGTPRIGVAALPNEEFRNSRPNRRRRRDDIV